MTPHSGDESSCSSSTVSARALQIGDACAIRPILWRLYDSCTVGHHRGEVSVAIRAVEADGGDAVFGRGVENQRKRTELEDGHARVAEARHDAAFRREPLDREEQILYPAVHMRDRHKHPLLEQRILSHSWLQVKDGAPGGPAKRSDQCSSSHVSRSRARRLSLTNRPLFAEFASTAFKTVG